MLTPLQLSATSQGPAEERQTAVLFASFGQLPLVPVQFSAGSHTPWEARHTVEDGRNASLGQLGLVPVHVSCGSQIPVEFRHVVPPLTKVQFELQHDPNEPFALPWSHCSLTDPSIVPLPHSEVNLTATKWPSLFCVRLGFPG